MEAGDCLLFEPLAQTPNPQPNPGGQTLRAFVFHACSHIEQRSEKQGDKPSVNLHNLHWCGLHELARANFEYGQQPGSLSRREAFARGPRQDAAPLLPPGRVIRRHGLYFAGECGHAVTREGHAGPGIPVLPYRKDAAPLLPAYRYWPVLPSTCTDRLRGTGLLKMHHTGSFQRQPMQGISSAHAEPIQFRAPRMRRVPVPCVTGVPCSPTGLLTACMYAYRYHEYMCS